MKKILMTIFAAVSTISMMAALTPTATAIITITSDNGNTAKLTLVESSTQVTAGYDNGYDSYLPTVQAGQTAIYAINGTDKYSTCMTNSFADLKIGIQTGADTHYTLTFTNVTGDVRLTINDEEITLANNGTKELDLAANSTIENLIVVNAAAFNGDEGELNVCHQYGKLTINNNPYTTNIVIVRNADETEVINKKATATPQEIDLTELNENPGYYTVKGLGEDMIIKVE